MINLQNIKFSYQSGIQVLNVISLSIKKGEFVSIVGQNGSGKSTFAKHINGLLKPDSGDVSINGKNISDFPIDLLAKNVGFVFQNPNHQIFSPTVWDEVSFGPRNLGLSENEIEFQTQQSMKLFGLLDYKDAEPAMVGFGIKKLISIASVHAMDPIALVLDEPTIGLDDKRKSNLMDIFCKLNKIGKTIILITHDMKLVAEFTSRCIVFNKGKVIDDGLTSNIFANKQLLKTAGLQLPQIIALNHKLNNIGIKVDKNAITTKNFAKSYIENLDKIKK